MSFSPYASWNMNSQDFKNAQSNCNITNDSKFNGRLFFTPQDNTKSYELFENTEKGEDNSINTRQEETELSKNYFLLIIVAFA